MYKYYFHLIIIKLLTNSLLRYFTLWLLFFIFIRLNGTLFNLEHSMHKTVKIFQLIYDSYIMEQYEYMNLPVDSGMCQIKEQFSLNLFNKNSNSELNVRSGAAKAPSTPSATGALDVPTTPGAEQAPSTNDLSILSKLKKQDIAA